MMICCRKTAVQIFRRNICYVAARNFGLVGSDRFLEPVFPSINLSISRKMSSKIRGTKRLEGTDENVWNVYTKMAADFKAVNVGQGFPDFSPPDYVKEALANATAGDRHILNQYTRGHGHPRLVNAISKLFSPLMGRDIDPLNEVIVTTGAYGALFCSFQAFIEDGDEVIIIEPFYDCYKPMTLMAGGVPKYVSLRPKATDGQSSSADWVFDEKELRSAFNSKTKAIVVNNPHNPLGKLYTREELQMIADLCIEHDVLCISDEVYEWLQYDAKHVRIGSLPGMWDRTLTIGSAGKTFSVTGWKIGWAMGAPELIKHLVTVWQNSVFHCNTPAAEAVAIGIEKEMSRFDSPDCYFTSLPRELREKRDQVAKLLSEVGMKPILPNGGYFMLADISGIEADLSGEEGETRDGKFVKWMIRNKKLATIPVSAFYSASHKKMGENYIRFCFCKSDETLNSMADILKQW
ncbi:kynurenine--oxoglutarate transaminase 3-like isoform X1 [Styela clava]